MREAVTSIETNGRMAQMGTVKKDRFIDKDGLLKVERLSK